MQTIPYTYGDRNWKDKLTAYNGAAISYWEESGQEALKLKNAIETDGGKVFGLEITQRETESAELCRQFFHISKR